ncbi:MAG: diacylglycerol/polyprenol kinase family protein [Candidatus Hydrothermarchaeales archaeon]
MDPLETKRQLIHASGLVLAFYVLWAGQVLSILTMGAILVIVVLISEGYRRGIKLPLISIIIDSAERPEVIGERPAKGAILFFVGSFASLLLFGRNLTIVSASIIILAIGDSASTIIGKNFGRNKIPYNKMKSLEGSVAGFVFALIGAQIFVKMPIAILGAFAAMLTESLPASVDDNITIPLFSGLVMSLAIYIF